MNFYNEDRAIAHHYQAQQELETLLSKMRPGETRVRILAYSRLLRVSVGTYQAYHPGPDFPFEITIGGASDFFSIGQFTLIEGGEND